jgi:hypothetical protein
MRRKRPQLSCAAVSAPECAGTTRSLCSSLRLRRPLNFKIGQAAAPTSWTRTYCKLRRYAAQPTKATRPRPTSGPRTAA